MEASEGESFGESSYQDSQGHSGETTFGRTGADGRKLPRVIEIPVIKPLQILSGDVYGFVYHGEIYLDETKLDPQVSIHEYTHIWDEAVLQSKPALWNRGKRLLKTTQILAEEDEL